MHTNCLIILHSLGISHEGNCISMHNNKYGLSLAQKKKIKVYKIMQEIGYEERSVFPFFRVLGPKDHLVKLTGIRRDRKKYCFIQYKLLESIITGCSDGYNLVSFQRKFSYWSLRPVLILVAGEQWWKSFYLHHLFVILRNMDFLKKIKLGK